VSGRIGRKLVLIAICWSNAGLLLACSADVGPLKYIETGDNPEGSGGSSDTGSGVNRNGGTRSGGRATGGTSSGGTATTGGARPTGGSSTGGTTGNSTGGLSTTGGKATGGANTGGANGAATGGRPTGGSATGGSATSCQNFSFFVTSLAAMQRLSGTANGFGGDLKYGQVDGLTGADKICAEIAATSLACASTKTWRAFLSTSSVDAIDRIGRGPWYDRNGLRVWNAMSEMSADRPLSTYVYRDDLPNEDGVPNHDYDLDGTTADDDNHDFLTGSDTNGRKVSTESAAARCNDWMSLTASGRPWCGHSWPRSMSGAHWIHSHQEGGCGACVNLIDTGGPTSACVGSAGGYGGIYCFALTP
jgi:hypothetical protein